jgi:malate dehydrogenase (oxaloacetate-decarboxylating)(NADP+)
MMEEGLTAATRQRCWFVDSTGLVVKSQAKRAVHKLPYAHDHEFVPDLLTAVQTLKPTVLIGGPGRDRATDFTPDEGDTHDGTIIP